MSLTFNTFISISYERVSEAVTFIENYWTDRNIIFQPSIGIICGSGLSMKDIRYFLLQTVINNSQATCLSLLTPSLHHWTTRRSPTIPSLLSLVTRENCCWEGSARLIVSSSRAELTFIKDSLRLRQLFLSE